MSAPCTCGASAGGEHFVTCPVYESPLTYAELRQVRALLSVPPLPRLQQNGVRDTFGSLGPYLAPEAFDRSCGPDLKDILAADQIRTSAHRAVTESAIRKAQ